MKKELVKLIENSSADITKEHVGIIEMLLQISTPVRLDNLFCLTKSICTKENGSSY